MSEKIETIARVSAKSVLKHTGKDWNQWIEILDRTRAHQWTYQEITAHLGAKYRLTIWWRGIVTIGYETHIGRRVEGRNLKGQYSTSSTKSFYFGGKELWAYLISKKGQAIWLKPLSTMKFNVGETFETEDGFFGEVRTIKAGQRVRLRWQDPEWEKPSVVQIWCIDRAGTRSMAVFMHEQLRDGRARLHFKAHWTQVMQELEASAPKGKTAVRKKILKKVSKKKPSRARS